MRNYLEAMFRSDCEFAKQMMQDRGALPSTYILRNYDGSIMTLVSDGSMDGHEAALVAVRLAALAYDTEALTSMIEAWCVDVKPGDPVVPVYKSDRRREIIMVRMETAGDALHAHYEIERSADGGCSGLTEMDNWSGDAVEEQGRMIGLISPERPTAGQRKEALRVLDKAKAAGLMLPVKIDA